MSHNIFTAEKRILPPPPPATKSNWMSVEVKLTNLQTANNIKKKLSTRACHFWRLIDSCLLFSKHKTRNTQGKSMYKTIPATPFPSAVSRLTHGTSWFVLINPFPESASEVICCEWSHGWTRLLGSHSRKRNAQEIPHIPDRKR